MTDVTRIAGAVLKSGCARASRGMNKSLMMYGSHNLYKVLSISCQLLSHRRDPVYSWPLSELNFHAVHNIFMSPMKSHIK